VLFHQKARLFQRTRTTDVILATTRASIEELLHVQILLVANVALRISIWVVLTDVRVDNAAVNLHWLTICAEDIHLVIVDAKINL
jgi:hypothetical protein